MPKRAWRLACLFLFSPSRAAEASRQEENLVPCAWIYLAFTAGYMLFFTLKPHDFPDPNASFPREPQTLMFWFKVMLWQPPLEAAWIAFLLGLAAWFGHGNMAVRLILAVAWTAVPFILMALYASNAGLPKAALAAGTAVWLGLFLPLWRRARRSETMPIVAFMLGVNAVGAAVLAPMAAAVLARSSGLFMASQATGGLWLLVCGTVGLRGLTGLRLPRAFMAILLSLFFQIALAFTLHLLGLVPKDMLKALLYA